MRRVEKVTLQRESIRNVKGKERECVWFCVHVLASSEWLKLADYAGKTVSYTERKRSKA